MSKIKEIRDRMQANPSEYSHIRFLMAKRVFVIVAMLYFLSYLFTVWGFYFGPMTLDRWSMVAFQMYSVFVIATVWFLYAIAEYALSVYAPGKSWLALIALLIGIVFGGVAIAIHLGLISSFSL